MTISEAAKILRSPVKGNALLYGVAIDSRKVKPGDLFVCLTGERVDGHDYADQALKAGAAAILTQRPLALKSQAPVIEVDNCEKALADLARAWRQKSEARVICITGTAGKTTVKDALSSILGSFANIARTDKNHNNQIGLPCSILAASGKEDFWIMEAGISHAGDMEELGDIIRPDLALIVNSGPGHTAGLGVNGVAWHKSRLLKFLAPGGQALVSADYPELMDECDKLGRECLYFSTQANPRADFQLRQNGSGDLELHLRKDIFKAHSPLAGAHGAESALAAAAAAHLLGASPAAISQGLSGMKLPEHRFNQSVRGGWRVIDDVYNANPLSMRASIEEAARLARQSALPWIAVLGEMGELGDEAAEWHFQTGQWLARAKPEALFWKGNYFENVRAGLNDQAPMRAFTDNEEFARIFKESIRFDKGLILFKGSRSNKLEEALGAFSGLVGDTDVL